jgi:hypothetical protein
MKTITTIPEAAEQLEKFLKHYFEKLGWKNIPIEKMGDFLSEEPENSDLRVVINSWLIITPFLTTENHSSILGDIRNIAIHYTIDREVFIRSCNRDDPDEWDIETVDADVSGLFKVIEKCLHLMFQNDLDGIGENIEADDMAHEEEEFSKLEGI